MAIFLDTQVDRKKKKRLTDRRGIIPRQPKTHVCTYVYHIYYARGCQKAIRPFVGLKIDNQREEVIINIKITTAYSSAIYSVIKFLYFNPL